MTPRRLVVVALLLMGSMLAVSRPAAAQIVNRPRLNFHDLNFDSVAPAAPARSEDSASEPRAPHKPSVLMTSLYGLTALAQALDAHSTMSALHAGAREGNPVMAALTSHPPAFIALKAGAAVGLIYAGHSVAKHSKLQAVIALAAIDSVYFAIAAHNYHVAARLR